MWFLLALGCWLCLCWLLGQRTPAGANAVFSPVERIDPDKATLDEEHRFANVLSSSEARAFGAITTNAAIISAITLRESWVRNMSTSFECANIYSAAS